MPLIILYTNPMEIINALNAEFDRLGKIRDEHLEMAKSCLKQQKELTDVLDRLVSKLKEEDVEVESLAE